LPLLVLAVAVVPISPALAAAVPKNLHLDTPHKF